MSTPSNNTKPGRKAKDGSEWVSSYYETFKNSEKAKARHCDVCDKDVAYFSWSNHCKGAKHQLKLVQKNRKDFIDNFEAIKAEEVKKFMEETTRKRKRPEDSDEESICEEC